MDRIHKLALMDQIEVCPFKDTIAGESAINEEDIDDLLVEYLEGHIEVDNLQASKILDISPEVEKAIKDHWLLHNVEKGDYIIHDGKIWNCKDAQETLDELAEDYENPYDEIVEENCRGLV